VDVLGLVGWAGLGWVMSLMPWILVIVEKCRVTTK